MKKRNRPIKHLMVTANRHANLRRGPQLFRSLELVLSEAYGRHLTLRQLAEITGQSITTIFDWHTDAKLNQVETLLLLLERLPPAKRMEVISRACRTLPHIRDERLGWDESQVARLEWLLSQRCGITIIEGEESSGGHLLSALGHSSPQGLPVCGIDDRTPDRFVPVDDVLYGDDLLASRNQNEFATKAWSLILASKNHLVLLMGSAPNKSDLFQHLLSLSEHSHVVAAGGFGQALRKFNAGLPAPCRIITTSTESRGRIQLKNG